MVVEPSATPVTIPVVPMVAASVLVLLHVPPEVVLVSVIVLPAQTDEAPPIVPTPTAGLMVSACVVEARPQPLVMK